MGLTSFPGLVVVVLFCILRSLRISGYKLVLGSYPPIADSSSKSGPYYLDRGRLTEAFFAVLSTATVYGQVTISSGIPPWSSVYI